MVGIALCYLVRENRTSIDVSFSNLVYALGIRIRPGIYNRTRKTDKMTGKGRKENTTPCINYETYVMTKKSCIPEFSPASLGAKLLPSATLGATLLLSETLGAKLFPPFTIVGTIVGIVIRLIIGKADGYGDGDSEGIAVGVADGSTEGSHIGLNKGC